MVLLAVAVQPFASVKVTLYVVVAVGVTVFVEPVPNELSQLNVPVPLALRFTLAPLSTWLSSLVQELSVAVIAVLGALMTVIVLLAVAVQPLASVKVTLYIVVAVGVTVFVEPVPNELSQLNVPVPLALRFTLAPLST